MKTLIVSAIFISFTFVSGQTKTNYEIINQLISGSLVKVLSEYSEGEEKEKIVFKADFPDGYSVLKNRSFNFLHSLNPKVELGTLNDFEDISYTLEQISVDYGETFRKNIFSDYYSVREIKISGTSVISKSGKKVPLPFSESYSDTVAYDLLEQQQNNALPFTRGEIPEEPLFRSILEPAVALTAAVVTIYLFFDVRSK